LSSKRLETCRGSGECWLELIAAVGSKGHDGFVVALITGDR
jgi:hypothetical protein